MALQRLPLIISGVDFTEDANISGYETEPVTVYGPNSMDFLAGTHYPDVIGYRTNIYWGLNDLRSARLAVLYRAIRQAAQVPVTYYEDTLDATTTGYFEGKISRHGVLWLPSGKRARGLILTLEGR